MSRGADVGPAERAPQRANGCCSLIGPDPSSAALIRRGRRVADYLQADCFAVYVSKTPDLQDLTAEERESLERHLNFARGLQIETRILQGTDVADTLVDFRPDPRRHADLRDAREADGACVRGSPSALVQRIVNLARDMQVTVVADRSIRHAAT